MPGHYGNHMNGKKKTKKAAKKAAKKTQADRLAMLRKKKRG